MKEEIEEILMNSYDKFGFFDEAKATKELLNLFSVNKRAFNVTYLANDEITKGLIVLAENEKEAMNKALELRGSRDVYSAIEVNVC